MTGVIRIPDSKVALWMNGYFDYMYYQREISDMKKPLLIFRVCNTCKPPFALLSNAQIQTTEKDDFFGLLQSVSLASE